jgi:hypothetical protein
LQDLKGQGNLLFVSGYSEDTIKGSPADSGGQLASKPTRWNAFWHSARRGFLILDVQVRTTVVGERFVRAPRQQ